MCLKINDIIRFSLVSASILLSVGSYAYAAPVVSSVAGMLTHGSTLTINGSGFGTKSTAAPLIWENFEWGNDGDEIHGINEWTQANYGGTINTQIDTTRSYGVGSRSSYYLVDPLEGTQAPEDEEFGFIRKSFVESDQVYVSYIARIEYTPGTSEGMWKIARVVNWSAAPSYNKPPYIGVTWFSTEFDAHYDLGYGFTNYANPTGFRSGVWYRVEMWVKLSSPAGMSNGELGFWLNYAQKNPQNVTLTRSTVIAGEKIDTFISPHMYVNSVGGKYEMWMDDLYIDNTKTRVEICNSNKWSTRTHCEIQIPIAWAPESITASINQGSFPNLVGEYLYILDANGNVSNSGIGLALCPDCPNPPVSPQVE